MVTILMMGDAHDGMLTRGAGGGLQVDVSRVYVKGQHKPQGVMAEVSGYDSRSQSVLHPNLYCISTTFAHRSWCILLGSDSLQRAGPWSFCRSLPWFRCT
eukprot:2200880-Rhodomonas_salina.2